MKTCLCIICGFIYEDATVGNIDSAQSNGSFQDLLPNRLLKQAGHALAAIDIRANAHLALVAMVNRSPGNAAFAPMPVSVKTPALVLSVPLSSGTASSWHAPETGICQGLDKAGVQRSFVLSGSRTAQRMAESKRVVL